MSDAPGERASALDRTYRWIYDRATGFVRNWMDEREQQREANEMYNRPTATYGGLSPAEFERIIVEMHPVAWAEDRGQDREVIDPPRREGVGDHYRLAQTRAENNIEEIEQKLKNLDAREQQAEQPQSEQTKELDGDQLEMEI